MDRILFDRSIFHKEKFELLKTSSLTRQVKHNNIRVFFTSTFIEETLTRSLDNMGEFASHWNFIISLQGAKWFKPGDQIVEIELSNNIEGEYYYLVPKGLIRFLLRNVKDFIAGKLSESEFKSIAEEVDKNKKDRQEFRKLRVDSRSEVKPGNYNFDEYVESNAELFIEKSLTRNHEDSPKSLDTWRKHRAQCRFTELFLRAWLSTVFLPLSNHTLRVDLNDSTDAEQLAYMTWADTMISDDTRFMKAAFDLLFQGTGKKILTLREFLEYLPESRE
jgi:hypothetical protein